MTSPGGDSHQWDGVGGAPWWDNYLPSGWDNYLPPAPWPYIPPEQSYHPDGQDGAGLSAGAPVGADNPLFVTQHDLLGGLAAGGGGGASLFGEDGGLWQPSQEAVPSYGLQVGGDQTPPVPAGSGPATALGHPETSPPADWGQRGGDGGQPSEVGPGSSGSAAIPGSFGGGDVLSSAQRGSSFSGPLAPAGHSAGLGDAGVGLEPSHAGPRPVRAHGTARVAPYSAPGDTRAPGPPAQPRPSTSHYLTGADKDWIRTLASQGKNGADIARETGFHERTVNKFLQNERGGQPLIKHLTGADKDRIRTLASQGKKGADIARETGFNKRTVNSFLRNERGGQPLKQPHPLTGADKDRIRTLASQGKNGADIARETGFKKRAVSKFLQNERGNAGRGSGMSSGRENSGATGSAGAGVPGGFGGRASGSFLVNDPEQVHVVADRIDDIVGRQKQNLRKVRSLIAEVGETSSGATSAGFVQQAGQLQEDLERHLQVTGSLPQLLRDGTDEQAAVQNQIAQHFEHIP